MTERVTISGTFEWEDYYQCHATMAVRQRFWFRLLISLMGLVELIFAINAAIPSRMIVGVVFGALVILYALAIYPIQFRYQVRRDWFAKKATIEPIEMVFDREGITEKDDRGNPSLIAWKRVEKAVEADSAFLLYIHPTVPVCVPKRWLGTGDMEAFRALLREHAGLR